MCRFERARVLGGLLHVHLQRSLTASLHLQLSSLSNWRNHQRQSRSGGSCLVRYVIVTSFHVLDGVRRNSYQILYGALHTRAVIGRRLIVTCPAITNDHVGPVMMTGLTEQNRSGASSF